VPSRGSRTRAGRQCRPVGASGRAAGSAGRVDRPGCERFHRIPEKYIPTHTPAESTAPAPGCQIFAPRFFIPREPVAQTPGACCTIHPRLRAGPSPGHHARCRGSRGRLGRPLRGSCNRLPPPLKSEISGLKSRSPAPARPPSPSTGILSISETEREVLHIPVVDQHTMPQDVAADQTLDRLSLQRGRNRQRLRNNPGGEMKAKKILEAAHIGR